MIKIVDGKIKNNNGSAMTLAIIVLFIATMAIGLFTFQVINQIKFTKSTEDSMVSRYEVEGGLEVVLAELIYAIDIEVNTERFNTGNSGKYNTVKTIVVDYLTILNRSTSQYLKNREYDIDVNTELKQSEIKLEYMSSISSKSNGKDKTTIVLKENVNSLKKIMLPYYISISHKSNNTKAKKFKIDIEVADIVESDSYSIGYKIEEVE